jgi:hypothetical protein
MPFCKRCALPAVELAVPLRQAARLFLLSPLFLGGLLVEGGFVAYAGALEGLDHSTPPAV